MPLTKLEAASLLGVHSKATPEQIRSRFHGLFNEYETRLTNAPTPGLKRLYQQSITELREAGELLCPGATRLGEANDLPSSVPVLVCGDQRRSTLSTRSPRSAETRLAAADEARGSLFSVPFKVAAGAAILLAAASAFLLLRWTEAHAKVEQATDRVAALETRMEEATARLRSFENQPFQICNLSSSEMLVSALAVTYLDDEGKVGFFNSTSYGWDLWRVREGSRQKLELVLGQDVIWDGSVFSYAMWTQYRGEDLFLMGTSRQVEDGCFKVNLDASL